MLKIKNISKSFGKFELKPIDLEIFKGEYFVILGLSGVGKSVLLETVAGLIKQDQGEILLNDERIENKKIQERKIGLVYQDNNLFPHLSVEENIEFPLKTKKIKKQQRSEIVKKLLTQVDALHLIDREVEVLSGGESQRVSLARTLASEPEVLLLDEPISSLDIKSKAEMRKLLRKINRSGQTILHVTHDYEEAVSLAGRIAVMENGKVIQTDTPEEIFSHPKSEFVAKFVGIKNFIKGNLKENSGSELKDFEVNNFSIKIASESGIGESYLMIAPENITISSAETSDSSVNHFRGVIVDIAPATIGVEVTIDIGINLIALITKESLKKLNLEVGKNAVVNFKATACKIYN